MALFLQDVLQENGIVIFSYPKANTGGCTRQVTTSRCEFLPYRKCEALLVDLGKVRESLQH